MIQITTDEVKHDLSLIGLMVKDVEERPDGYIAFLASPLENYYTLDALADRLAGWGYSLTFGLATGMKNDWLRISHKQDGARRNPQIIEKLKVDWSKDPCWEIEYTEGFEAHEKELAAFAESKRREWRAEHDVVANRRSIITMRAPLTMNCSSSLMSDDDRVSTLMADGWVIQDVQIVTYIDNSGDFTDTIFERFVTLTRDPGVKSAEQQRIEKLEAALRRIEDLHSYELEQAYDIAAELLNVYTP